MFFDDLIDNAQMERYGAIYCIIILSYNSISCNKYARCEMAQLW